MSRPLQFPKLANRGGLVIGKSIADGLNSAAESFVKIRQQRMQNQIAMMNAQNMAAYRQMQARALQEKTLRADMTKLDMLRSAGKSGRFDPKLVSKFESQYMDQILQNMTPDQAMAAKKKFDQEASQGEVDPMFNEMMSLNMREQQMQKDWGGNQVKENIAGLNAGVKQSEGSLNRQSQEKRTGMMAAAMGGKNQTFNDRNTLAANNAYGQQVGKKYEDRIDAVDRIKALLDAVNKGLVPTEYLNQQLASDITLAQAMKTTVSGINHSRPNSLPGKVGEWEHWTTGKPVPAVTPEDLGQISKEVGVLKDEIGAQHKTGVSSFLAGLPTQMQEPLMYRANIFRSQHGMSPIAPNQTQNAGTIPAAQQQAPQGNQPPARGPKPSWVPDTAVFSPSSGKYYDPKAGTEILAPQETQ